MSGDARYDAALVRLATQDVQALLGEVRELLTLAQSLRDPAPMKAALSEALTEALGAQLTAAADAAKAEAVARLARVIERRTAIWVALICAGVAAGYWLGAYTRCM